MASVSWKHRISGLVVEYIVAIDVTRARFPADAYVQGIVVLGEESVEEFLGEVRRTCGE